eukprot:6188918-Pleurochrysis_carterae.AAC.1
MVDRCVGEALALRTGVVHVGSGSAGLQTGLICEGLCNLNVRLGCSGELSCKGTLRLESIDAVGSNSCKSWYRTVSADRDPLLGLWLSNCYQRLRAVHLIKSFALACYRRFRNVFVIAVSKICVRLRVFLWSTFENGHKFVLASCTQALKTVIPWPTVESCTW